MGCKYCELKRRKDDGVEWIAGEDWESESDDGGYICPNDDGFRMLVYYDARCACTAVDNIKYCPFCGAELTLPKEPLIKDEKIRKAVRAWAEAIEANEVVISYSRHDFLKIIDVNADSDICFDYELGYTFNEDTYTIAELCGEEEE